MKKREITIETTTGKITVKGGSSHHVDSYDTSISSVASETVDMLENLFKVHSATHLLSTLIDTHAKTLVELNDAEQEGLSCLLAMISEFVGARHIEFQDTMAVLKMLGKPENQTRGEES